MLDLFRTLPPILLYHTRRDLIYPYGTVVAQANVLFSSDLVKSSVIEISLITCLYDSWYSRCFSE